MDVRPWVFDVDKTRLLPFFGANFSQPVELGHRTAHRTAIADAEYQVTRWSIVQADLLALVQTYRGYETAAYRRDKLQVARELGELNSRLLDVLRRQLEANQAPAADVLVAEVENLSAQQRVEAARQDYADALATLREQIGIVELADSAEPDGKLEAPRDDAIGEEESLLRMAFDAQARNPNGPRRGRAVPRGLVPGPGRPNSDSLGGSGVRKGRVGVQLLRDDR